MIILISNFKILNYRVSYSRTSSYDLASSHDIPYTLFKSGQTVPLSSRPNISTGGKGMGDRGGLYCAQHVYRSILLLMSYGCAFLCQVSVKPLSVKNKTALKNEVLRPCDCSNVFLRTKVPGIYDRYKHRGLVSFACEYIQKQNWGNFFLMLMY